MRILILIGLFFLGGETLCFAQDSVQVKNRKGFLFLSAYNYRYDYHGGHMRPLGFHDFFFETPDFDPASWQDSTRSVNFQNGIRVDFFGSRTSLKKKAKMIKCVDTSRCYQYDSFYVLPVIITGKTFKDYEPLICRRDYYKLQVIHGSGITFKYLSEAIKLSKVQTLPMKK